MIGELSDYSDFGVQQYGTTGWDSDPNYTAQPTNATHGTHRFHARTLDPETGTWTSQDPWHGLLSGPQTLNRYAYVTNNPATLIDHLGYWGWDDIQRFASDTVTNINNAVSTAMTNFNSWIRPDTRPVGHLATIPETRAAPNSRH